MTKDEVTKRPSVCSLFGSEGQTLNMKEPDWMAAGSQCGFRIHTG